MRQVEGSESKKIKPPLKNSSSNTGANTKAVSMNKVVLESVIVCLMGKKDKRIENVSIKAQPSTVSLNGGFFASVLKFNPVIRADTVYSVYFIIAPKVPDGVIAVPKTITATAAKMRQFFFVKTHF